MFKESEALSYFTITGHFSRSIRSVLLTTLSLCLLSIGSINSGGSHADAKVRPSDISYPTNQHGLGRGYDLPGSIFNVSIWGGFGEVLEPYKNRSHWGVLFESRSNFESGELGFNLAMLKHNVEFEVDDNSGVYSSNLALDWRWRGGDRGRLAPFFGVGVAIPTRSLSGEGEIEGTSQLDALRVGLASRFGGFKRWMWEPNSAAAFIETGGNTHWGKLFLEGEVAVAYLYRVIESTEVESANLFAQVGGDLGILNETWRLTVGGGYAISPLSLAGDVDQIHGRVKFVYSPKTVDYYLSLLAPIDAPMGVIDGEMGWSLALGVVGQL